MTTNLVSCVGQGWLDAMSARAVQVSAPGEGLLRLDAVELGPQHNKPRTNVLLRWQAGRQGWDFFVDDDLQYLGDDPARRLLFTGPQVHHWRAVVAPCPVCGDVHDAVLHLLDWLESPMRQTLSYVARPPAAADSPLSLDLQGVAGIRGGGEVTLPGFEPTSAQADAIDRIAAAVTQRVSSAFPLVHGPSGCGKHSVARAAASVLIARGLFGQVLDVSGAALAAGMLFRPQRDERLARCSRPP